MLRSLSTQAFTPISIFVILGKLTTYLSYQYVSIALAHTAKASEPIFNVIVAACLFGEYHSRQVYLSLVPISLGIMLASVSDFSYNHTGFAIATSSALMKVMQNIYTKRLMETGKWTFWEIHLYCGAASLLIMLPILYLQQVTLASAPFSHFPIFALMLDSLLQWASSVSAYVVLSLVSHLTATIVNVMKRLVMIVSGDVYDGKQMGWMNGLGVFLAMVGILTYNMVKDSVWEDDDLIDADDENDRLLAEGVVDASGHIHRDPLQSILRHLRWMSRSVKRALSIKPSSSASRTDQSSQQSRGGGSGHKSKRLPWFSATSVISMLPLRWQQPVHSGYVWLGHAIAQLRINTAPRRSSGADSDGVSSAGATASDAGGVRSAIGSQPHDTSSDSGSACGDVNDRDLEHGGAPFGDASATGVVGAQRATERGRALVHANSTGGWVPSAAVGDNLQSPGNNSVSSSPDGRSGGDGGGGGHQSFSVAIDSFASAGVGGAAGGAGALALRPDLASSSAVVGRGGRSYSALHPNSGSAAVASAPWIFQSNDGGGGRIPASATANAGANGLPESARASTGMVSSAPVAFVGQPLKAQRSISDGSSSSSGGTGGLRAAGGSGHQALAAVHVGSITRSPRLGSSLPAAHASLVTIPQLPAVGTGAVPGYGAGNHGGDASQPIVHPTSQLPTTTASASSAGSQQSAQSQHRLHHLEPP